VVTIAWAQSAEEEISLLRSLSRLAGAGYPVVVADRSTRATFTSALGEVPGVRVVVPTLVELAGQIKASVSVAAFYATRYLLYVEPDKEDFFTRRLRDFVARAPDDDDIGIVLASRSSGSLDTYPPMQRYTESVFNNLCGRAVETAGDYTYGPFLMHQKLVPHVAAVDPGLGWGWRPSTFVAANRGGLRITHVVDDHPCPADQRQEDDHDRRHRLRQLSENIMGLLS
jgi:hypothetical protein